MQIAREVFTKAQLHRFGTFILGGPLQDATARALCKSLDIQIRAGNEGNDAGGGYLVPDEFGPVLRRLLDRYGLLRRYAQRTSMASDSKQHPRRTGAATIYFPGEGEAPAESDVTWNAVRLTAHKALALFRVSMENYEDAEEFATEIADEFSRGLAQAEDTIGFAGDGTGNHMGVHGIATVLADGAHAGGVAAAAGHDTFIEIDAGDVVNLMARLPARAVPGAAFYASQLGAALALYRLAGANGGIVVVNGEPTFAGFPIRVTATLPQVATTLAGKAMLLFGDLELAALLADRKQISIATSAAGPTVFGTDEVLIKGRARLDINIHDLGDATNAGALVALLGA